MEMVIDILEEQIDTLYTLLVKSNTIANKSLFIQTVINAHDNQIYTFSQSIIDTFRDLTVFDLMLIQNTDFANLYNQIKKELHNNIDVVEDTGFVNINQNMPPDFKEVVAVIAKQATKNDKMSWWRLQRQLNGLLDELDELNVPFFEFQDKLKTAMILLKKEYESVVERRDHVVAHLDTLSVKMKAECIHPADYIVFKDGKYHCKFCDSNINLIKE